ncbi:hypothetical protein N657DRAFT_566399 [Parathielavia appendiculata]|uniref:Uncharacterized protein n=1 Tax=Parathielavia appendiculata TaxID=2587402 RepID=A0AAN6U7E3_9PEZI|nr:hypothetical protein N657DRAFT_566399 [Parathielavia appendiculata]
MVKHAFVAYAGLAAALPLNINLGAYSPALVVGDGEISFGGRQDVSNLITALEGAAVNAAAGAANAAEGAGNAAAAAPTTVPNPLPNTVASASTDPALAEQAQQIAAIQGLGKAIKHRVDSAETEKFGKRNLAGFDRALTYAEAALTKGPKVQLGTGEEGSGIGIIVEHTPAGGAAEKRDLSEVSTPRRRAAKVTTMFVRRGVPVALQSRSGDEDLAGRAPTTLPAQAATAPPAPLAVSKRDRALDAVNLNVDGDAGVTMTFVEAFDDEKDDERSF